MTEQQRRRVAVTVYMVIASLLATVIVSTTFTTWQIHRTNVRTDHQIELSNQRWCSMYSAILQPRPNPLDPTFKRELQRLQVVSKCPVAAK